MLSLQNMLGEFLDGWGQNGFRCAMPSLRLFQC